MRSRMIADWLKNAWQAWRARQEDNATRNDLLALDDRELDDIGLSRYDIINGYWKDRLTERAMRQAYATPNVRTAASVRTLAPAQAANDTATTRAAA